jgi:ABC-type branched-subunit amino acid transport system ATPase component
MTLAVVDVSLAFGGFQALKRVSIAARPGEIVGLVGPNGSGKSTLLNVVAGLYVPDSGAVTLDGARLPAGSIERVAAHGVGRTFQVPRLAQRLTVFQNMMVGARNQPGERLFDLFLRPGAVAAAESGIAGRATAILRRLEIAHKANDIAGALSGGQQKLLTMGVLLMADPKLLLLDEPAAGVNPVLIEQQVALLRSLRDEGRIIVLVEHNMEMVTSVCDKVYVLDAGSIIAEGTPAEIRANDDVIRSYLGQPA